MACLQWGYTECQGEWISRRVNCGAECQGEWISRRVNCGAIQSARVSGLVDELTVGLYRVPG